MASQTAEPLSILKHTGESSLINPDEEPPRVPSAPRLDQIETPTVSQHQIHSFPRLRNTPTMFDSIPEDNVVFCIDTSGSMYNALDAVKEHLVEALMQRAYRDEEPSLFNLLEFSSEVTQWSDQMVRCTPETVAVATDWIQRLESKTSTNTMDALMTAFSEESCDAVCLVTDGHPDQHPTDILDNVGYAAQNRPVHCIYIHSGQPESLSSSFLQDLAMETYGSYHVIAITLHGSIEKITPVYRADHAAERIIRTTDGSIYPSNHKICSVTTSLAGPIPDVVYDPYYVNLPPPQYPYHFYPYPLRHYYQVRYPDVGWSRYRASRAGLRVPTPNVSPSIPGPGATLISQTVLARRNSDGYFYLATVKSQILANKFLIEFGPCKHGKYRTTSYQETYVHDLVAHTDALRHSVCVRDLVLAPFEPEGSRYGPGVVIQGQEARDSQVGEDEDIIVSFHNGKSCRVPRDTACWIPKELHERVTFELKLPKQVRCEFAEKDTSYPEENVAGYPTSGPRQAPVDYQVHESGWLERRQAAPMTQTLYNPFYVPHYPVYFNHAPQLPRSSVVMSDDMIPGTGLTRAELNEKVMSQLMKHKMVSEDQKELKEVENQRLLQRRSMQEENMLAKSLEKSVTFKDPDSDLEGEVGDLETRDSGRGSSHDLELSDFEDTTEDTEIDTRDKAVGTDPSLLARPRVRRSQNRPPWRYWNNETAPTLLDPMHEGPYRLGPYEGGLPTMNIERRPPYAEGGYGVAMSSFADHMAKSKMGQYGVADSMHMPKPPDYKPEKQQPGLGVSDTLHGNMSEADKLAQYRVDYRRQKTFERENEVRGRRDNEDKMALMMLDQHRENVQAQLNREQQRHLDQAQRDLRLREAKKEINSQVRSRIVENQDRERCRDDQRTAALQARRQRLDDIRQQRADEIENIKAQRMAVRQEKAQLRWERTTQALDEQDRQQSAQLQRAQSAKAFRMQRFRNMEDNNQKHKQYLAEVNDQRSSIFRSRIFP